MNKVILYGINRTDVAINEGVAYVCIDGFYNPKVSLLRKWFRFWRRIEGRLCDWTGYNQW